MRVMTWRALSVSPYPAGLTPEHVREKRAAQAVIDAANAQTTAIIGAAARAREAGTTSTRRANSQDTSVQAREEDAVTDVWVHCTNSQVDVKRERLARPGERMQCVPARWYTVRKQSG